VDLTEIIKLLGYPGMGFLAFFLFASPFGIVIPGDSMLVVAGLLSSQLFFNPVILIVCLPIFSILGDLVGFMVGKIVGPAVFERTNSKLFRKKYLNKAKKYLDENGTKKLILIKFIPIVRTFVPLVAGATNMKIKIFIFLSFFSSYIWVSLLFVLGYFVGSSIPGLEHHLLAVTILVVILSLIPAIIERKKAG